MDQNTSRETADREADDFNTSDRGRYEGSLPRTGDGASPGKIFVGGLSKETTPAQFIRHFGKYGDIIDSVIMRDRITGNPRGFGFITYSDPSVVDKVIEDTHVINGKQVEIKRTIPRGSSSVSDFKTKKIFVGGIPTTLTEDEFKNFFSKFGLVKDYQIMKDHTNNRSRGFGFITFDSEKTVEELLREGNRLDLDGTKVEIKKAEPKRANLAPPPFRRYSDVKSGYGSAYHESYGGSRDNGYGVAAPPFRGGGGGGYGSRGGYGGGGSGYDYDDYGGMSWSNGGGGGLRGGGGYRGEAAPLGYSGGGRYGEALNRGGYDVAGAGGGSGHYGGFVTFDRYGPDGNQGDAYGGSGYGGSYDAGYGGRYGGGDGGGPFGGRAVFGNANRYHPYAL